MLADIERIIREYFPDILHMSLATCANGKPWVCEVHFAYDEELNLYFRSWKTRRHSEEILSNPNVAGNMVVQHGPTDKPRGVYFEGKAEILENVDESHPAYLAFKERLGMGSEIIEDAAKDDGHKFFKITVSDFYVFDSRESKPSTKYHLRWKGE